MSGVHFSEPPLALDQRGQQQMLAVEVQEIEGEKNESLALALGGCLHQAEGRPVGADRAKLAIEIVRPTGRALSHSASPGYLLVQSSPHRAVMSWVAVELQLVSPRSPSGAPVTSFASCGLMKAGSGASKMAGCGGSRF